ncbi:T9SS type A sorting domain-containing protein [bacterium]|nr:T9SS type A sorting domain-containing protein [bacterium]
MKRYLLPAAVIFLLYARADISAQTGTALAKIVVDEKGNITVQNVQDSPGTPRTPLPAGSISGHPLALPSGRRTEESGNESDISTIVALDRPAGRSPEAEAALNPGPDLTPVTASLSCSWADPVLNISVTVANYGTTSSGACGLGYYLSTDATVTVSDYLVGTDDIPFLYPYTGSDEAISVDLTTVSGLPAGTYYAGIIVDFNHQVTEDIEHNNDYVWTSPMIGYSGFVDLTSVPANCSYAFTDPFLSIDIRVINEGVNAAPGVFVGYYLSSDAVISSSDYRIGTYLLPALDPGVYFDRELEFYLAAVLATPPLPEGTHTYYVGFIIDYNNYFSDHNEGNNSLAFTPSISFDRPPPAPDLGSMGWAYSTIGPQTLILSAFPRNWGSADAGACYLGWYLSDDTDITTADYLIGVDLIDPLAVGQDCIEQLTIDLNEPVTSTPPLPAGPHSYSIGFIIDYQDNIAELNENNNNWRICSWTLSGPLTEPDLIIQSLSVVDNEGPEIGFQCTVKNQGDGPAGESKVTFCLSPDQTVSTADHHILTWNISGTLAAGETRYMGSGPVSIAGIPPGEYYLGAIADANGQVSESNENNNTACDGSSLITVPLATGWTIQASGVSERLTSVSVVSDQDVWISGYNCILRTDDGGAAWTNVAGVLDTLRFSSIQAVSANTALAAGYNPVVNASGVYESYIFRTTNGGAAWSEVHHTDTFINAIVMFDQMNGFALGDVIEEKWFVLRTADGGLTWNPCGNAPAGGSGEFCYGNMGYYADHAGHLSYLSDQGWFTWTADCGQNWHSSYVNADNLPVLRTAAMDGHGTVLAGAVSEFRLFRSLNHGGDWAEIPPAADNTIMFLNFFDNRYWMLLADAIYSSADRGDTWVWETDADDALRDIDFYTVDTDLYAWAVGNSGTILKYTGAATPVEEDEFLSFAPDNLRLIQNYPNPFNPVTNISYRVPRQGKVTLRVYSALGEEIVTLLDKQQPAGSYQMTWNAAGLPSGVYICRLVTEGGSQSIKMLFMQ